MANFYDFAGDGIVVREIALKTLMPGVQSGTVYQAPKGSFLVGESKIDPSCGIPAHKGSQEAIFLVVEGDGVVYTQSEEGEVLAQTCVRAGDVLHYQAPFLNHRYEAGPEGLAYMVIPIT